MSRRPLPPGAVRAPLFVALLLAATGCGDMTQSRIGIRTPPGGTPEFYEVDTGASFVPRGANYVRLAPYSSGGSIPLLFRYPPADLTSGAVAVTLSPFAGGFDAGEVSGAFAAMRQHGYNTVRVFVDPFPHQTALIAAHQGPVAPKIRRCTGASPGVVCASDADCNGTDVCAVRLHQGHIDNVVALLQIAAFHGLRVVLSWGWLGPSYEDLVDAPCAAGDPEYRMDTVRVGAADLPICAHESAEHYNALFMHRGIIDAFALYVGDVLTAVLKTNADPAYPDFGDNDELELDVEYPGLETTILAIELLNEPFFTTKALLRDAAGGDIPAKPFSLASGVVSIGAAPYDMAVAADRRALADASARDWVATVASEVRSRSGFASALLTGGGLFTPYAVCLPGYAGGVPASPPACADGREPHRLRVYHDSPDVDFLSVHLYPVERPAFPFFPSPYLIGLDALSIELGPGRFLDGTPLAKPLMMGEFGALKFENPEVRLAAGVLLDQVVRSAGLGFRGWLLWSWDEPTQHWHAREQNDALARVLSPGFLPDPATTDRLVIRDDQGLLAQIDSNGSAVLAGSSQPLQASITPDDNADELVVRNANGVVQAMVDADGNLLSRGAIETGCTPLDGPLVVRDAGGVTRASITSGGDVCVSNALVELGAPSP